MHAAPAHAATAPSLTFATAPLVLVGVTLLAAWLPVRRAVRIDPTEALRSD